MTPRLRISRRFSFASLVASAALAASTSLGAITPTGDVTPTNPATWTTSTTAIIGDTSVGSVLVNAGSTLLSSTIYLGNTMGATGMVTVDGTGSTWTNSNFLWVGASGTGTLNITNGGQVTGSSYGYLGYNTGATGTVTADGTGSMWTIGSYLYLGSAGTGTLNITHGGMVTVTGTTLVAYASTATGSINFGPNGGTLTTQSLYAVPAQITGTGTINTRGVFNDGDLMFDATHGLNQTLTWIGANQNVTVHLDLTGGSGGAGDLGAGYQGTGTLAIRDGVTVTSGYGYLGYSVGATGTATVDGTGSAWTTSNLYVGNDGTGAPTITNGGKVSNVFGCLGYQAGATGTATVDGTSSTWTNSNSAIGGLSVGYSGTGTLTITNGGKVSSSDGNLGHSVGSAGMVIVDGPGSTWTNNSNPFGSLCVGNSGTGTLTITNGGQVSNTRHGYLGRFTGATGTATVDGTGSTWISDYLSVGDSGTGTLNITNGGTVTAKGVSINSLSLISMTVGDASKLDGGTGTLTNDGLIRLKAIPDLAPGSFVPITAASWSVAGTVQALGGKWDGAAHTFSVTAAASGNAGPAGVMFDRAQTQRAHIFDLASGDGVEAGFLPTTSASNLTFSAMALTDGQMEMLQSDLAAGGVVLTGWTFITAGYTPGDPVFLSLDVGPGHSTGDLSLWHYDGAAWTPYAANDLSYDGTYASFTVTGFSGYAVTAASPVPEPGAVAVLALGGMGVFLRRRRKR